MLLSLRAVRPLVAAKRVEFEVSMSAGNQFGLRSSCGGRLTLLRLAAAGALIACQSSALAEPEPSNSELAAARTLGIEGVKLASSGQCSEAVRLLERAAELYAAPTILLPLARCQISMGRLVDGVAVLKRILDTELPADASKQFVDAQAEAVALLSTTLPRVPRVSISIEVLGDVQPQVLVDGKPVPPSHLAALTLDPGSHKLTAKAPGYKLEHKAILIKEGDRQNVVFTLEPEPIPETTDQEPISAQPPTVEPEAPDQTLGWVSLGIGGAGLVAGSVFGIVASGKEKQLNKDCPNGRCPQRLDAELSNTKAYALGSTIGFAVGILGLGVGSYLLFFDQPSAVAPSGRARAPRLGAFIGSQQLGLAGEF